MTHKRQSFPCPELDASNQKPLDPSPSPAPHSPLWRAPADFGCFVCRCMPTTTSQMEQGPPLSRPCFLASPRSPTSPGGTASCAGCSPTSNPTHSSALRVRHHTSAPGLVKGSTLTRVSRPGLAPCKGLALNKEANMPGSHSQYIVFYRIGRRLCLAGQREELYGYVVYG